jgi:glycerophosphoryl diester phosphodiesterase
MSEKKDRSSYVDLNRPTIFAHRGSSVYAPENTLAAFKLAVEQRADGIELDVKLSADGQVVVMHDDTVDRTTNGTGRIKSLTLLDLKGLDAGSKFDPTFHAERIPTLAKVFDTVGGKVFINVELTNYSSPTDDLPDKVVSLVKNFGLEAKVLLSSFNLLALIRARYLLPMVHLGLLAFSGTADGILRSRLLRFGPRLALHPSAKDVSSQLILTAHRTGCRVHVYTVNEPDVMQRLLSDGVDGVFTDDPLMAQKVIAEYTK